MILKIVKDKNEVAVYSNTYMVSIDSLNNKGTHIYLASKNWEELQVELTDDIPKDCLRYLSRQCAKITPTYEEKLSQHQVSLLCELFPEKAGKIRASVIRTGGVPYELLR